jgi:hypothetical protein
MINYRYDEPKGILVSYRAIPVLGISEITYILVLWLLYLKAVAVRVDQKFGNYLTTANYEHMYGIQTKNIRLVDYRTVGL